MQEEREQTGRKKINSWERMKMHKKLMSLKQREMDVSTAYAEEFNKLTLRERKQEEEVDKVARYLNGLRQNIQDEISMMAPKIVHKCFSIVFERRGKDQEER